MNLNVVNVVVFGIGAILVYAAVKDIDPRNVVQSALGQTAPTKAAPTTAPSNYLHPPTGVAPGPVLSV